MDCPQCGGTLATYALSGREASVCEDCGYVGIAAEHRGDPRSIETWDDALRRFYRAHGHDGAPSVEIQPPLSRPSGSSTESWDDALRRFYARQTGEIDEPAPDATADGSTTGDEADGSVDAENADVETRTDEDGAPEDVDDADGVEAGAEADAGGR
jgi:hypothetical protein